MIIASNGMLTGGRSVGHAERLLDDPSATVLFVGYQGEGTLGGHLVRGAPTARIAGHEMQVKATIRSLDGFSAHADEPELLDVAGRLHRRAARRRPGRAPRRLPRPRRPARPGRRCTEGRRARPPRRDPGLAPDGLAGLTSSPASRPVMLAAAARPRPASAAARRILERRRPVPAHGRSPLGCGDARHASFSVGWIDLMRATHRGDIGESARGHDSDGIHACGAWSRSRRHETMRRTHRRRTRRARAGPSGPEPALIAGPRGRRLRSGAQGGRPLLAVTLARAPHARPALARRDRAHPRPVPRRPAAARQGVPRRRHLRVGDARRSSSATGSRSAARRRSPSPAASSCATCWARACSWSAAGTT